MKTILVPIDGSPPSTAALDHAVALAKDSGARIDVLHVAAPDEFALGSSRPASEAARREAEAAMEAAFERACHERGEGIGRLRVAGDPVRAILETASNGRYDLIVMGTHGWIGRLHMMLGSVAEAVIRNAPCPVLTVREPGAEYQSFAERRHGEPSMAEQTERHPG